VKWSRSRCQNGNPVDDDEWRAHRTRQAEERVEGGGDAHPVAHPRLTSTAPSPGEEVIKAATGKVSGEVRSMQILPSDDDVCSSLCRGAS
jgi:hypothetical protein